MLRGGTFIPPAALRGMNRRKPERSSPPHPEPDARYPAAGPHAKPELMDEEKTPGAGTLPPVGESDDGNAQPTG
jgi:hypothetical protein